VLEEVVKKTVFEEVSRIRRWSGAVLVRGRRGNIQKKTQPSKDEAEESGEREEKKGGR